MSRPRKRGRAKILYVEIVLDNGVRWRINLRTQQVHEIEDMAGNLQVRGPVRLSAFVKALDEERAARQGNRS